VNQPKALNASTSLGPGLLKHAIDDEHLWSAIFQSILVFPLTPAQVQGNYGRSDPCRPNREFKITVIVEHQNRHAITLVNAKAAQCGS
jgi:hypothetical protein